MKRRIITAAEDKVNDGLTDALGNLKDDFDYVMSGLEKLGRSGANASQDALAITENLSNDLARYMSDIANKISE